jgi:hypothetical protein
MVHI